MRRLITSFFVGSVVVLCVVVASADDNMIYACAKKVNGSLRVVTSTAECLPSEYPLEWSIQGPQGPQGEPGQVGSSITQYEYVGMTSDSVYGDFGIIGMSAMCGIEYQGSRMCTSQEILRSHFTSSDIPPILHWGWVQPVYAPVSPGFSTSIGIDMSGVSFAQDEGNLTCDGWASRQNEKYGLLFQIRDDLGLLDYLNGRFLQAPCDHEVRVVCCAPVTD